MEPLKHRSYLEFCVVALMTSSLIVTQYTTVVGALHCPSPCTCREGKSKDYLTDVYNIWCSNLGLTKMPDLEQIYFNEMIHYLYLDNNEIKEITRYNFPPRLNIEVLDLSSNIGMKISTNAFLNLGYSLKKLTLDTVDIAFDKPLVIFSALSVLEELSLSHNNMQGYTPGAVPNVKATLFVGEVRKSLKRLSLAFCRIRTMRENTLKGLSNLVELDLSNNYLISVPPTLRHLSNLRSVVFHYCHIISLQDNDFSGMSRLEEVDLSSNAELETISNKAFSGCENSLKKLNLQRCQLTDIPTRALSELKHMTFLDMSENKFTDVGSSPLAGEYKLTELVISSKELEFDPKMFKGQEENIKELSIPHMALQTVPLKALEVLTKLDLLFLEYNNITTLPKGAFEGLNVGYIRLDHNPLSSIEKGAFNGLPPKLTISLSWTKLTDIDFLMGYPKSAIVSVKLRYAKLVCRCSMKKSIGVLDNINHLTGDCMIGDDEVGFSSSRLGPLLDQACQEE